jgi:alpha-1,6-mannosyltransferase
MLQLIEILDIFFLCVIIFYLYCCPYTKVEESFNLQAIHDILEYRLNVGQYDHLQFPGVVPRTFIGAIIVSLISSPVYLVFSLFNFSGLHKQMLCRGSLGLLVWISFVWFRSGISKVFGKRASQLYVILTMLQFHTCFYATRTLPNIFALAICLWSFGYWLRVNTIFLP